MKRFLLVLLIPASLVCSTDPKKEWSPVNPMYPPLSGPPVYSKPPVYKDGPPVYSKPPVYKAEEHKVAQVAVVVEETGLKPSEWRFDAPVEEMVRVGCMDVPLKSLLPKK